MNCLLTGSSGFIGFHTAKKLLDRGDSVIGIDNENDYYDIQLKEDRRAILQEYDKFKFYKLDIADKGELSKVFESNDIDKICHLAAQAGVRYSIENPDAYISSNIVGFHNVINLAVKHKVENFVYASSSSVYGNNDKIPFSVKDRVDEPVSLYAASKKSNELIAHVYNDLYDISCIGLRFFTVYGPMGRPDMAYFKFANLMKEDKSIDVYNHGDMKRDFTYIDDIVNGIVKSLDSSFYYEIFNLGNDNPEKLMDFINYLEDSLGIQADKNMLPMQPGDVYATRSDIEYTKEKLDWKPTTSLKEGLDKFADWYKDYYNL